MGSMSQQTWAPHEAIFTVTCQERATLLRKYQDGTANSWNLGLPLMQLDCENGALGVYKVIYPYSSSLDDVMLGCCIFPFKLLEVVKVRDGEKTSIDH